MIDSMLMSLAIVNGTMSFEERRDDYRLFANVMGMKVTLATITKQQLAQALAQTADGSVAPVQPVETRPPAEKQPTAASESAVQRPVRQRPQLSVITGGAA